MARSRNIKPGFFLNDKLAEIDPLGRLLFAGLWTLADREGRLEDRPKRIKIEVLPYDNCDIDDLLDDLYDADFIQRYEVDGEKYIQIVNFGKHQNPHKNEKPSTIPAFEKHHTSTVQVPDEHSTNRADSFNLIPDSFNLIPDSLNSGSAEQKTNDDDFFKSDLTDEQINDFREVEKFWLAYSQKIQFTNKESKALEDLIKQQIPLSTVLEAINNTIDYYQKANGENKKIQSFTYCYNPILDLHDTKTKPFAPPARNNVRQFPSKASGLPKSVQEQLERERTGETETTMSPEELEQRKAAIQAKMKLMNERLATNRGVQHGENGQSAIR